MLDGLFGLLWRLSWSPKLIVLGLSSFGRAIPPAAACLGVLTDELF